jgi:hypothetical protein
VATAQRLPTCSHNQPAQRLPLPLANERLRARPSPVFRKFSPMASREAAMGGAAAFRSSMYNAFFRRTSVYVAVCVAAAYASTEAYLAGTDRVWASINKGVRSALIYSFPFASSEDSWPTCSPNDLRVMVAPHVSNCPPESLTHCSTSACLYNTITQRAHLFLFPSIRRCAVAEIMGRGQSNTSPKGRGRRLVCKSLLLLVVLLRSFVRQTWGARFIRVHFDRSTK